MGNAGGKSAPGTPTVSPNGHRSPVTTGQPLYKPHIRLSESKKSSIPEIPNSVDVFSTSWTTVDPSMGVTRENPRNLSSTSGSPIQANPKADSVFNTNGMPSAPKVLGSNEGKKAAARGAVISSENERAANLMRLNKNTSQEGKASKFVEQMGPSSAWTGEELGNLSTDSFPENSREYPPNGVDDVPQEDEEESDLQCSWSSSVANPDFMKLYWPNKVSDGEDDGYQRVSENLKKIILEVSNLQQELQELPFIVGHGRKVDLGSPKSSSGLRTKGQLEWEDTSENHKKLLNVAETWEPRLLGIHERLKAGLNDLDSIKAQNIALLRESILYKSKGRQEETTEVGTMVNPTGLLRDCGQEGHDKIKGLDMEVRKLQQRLHERQEASKLEAESQFRLEAELREHKSQIQELETEKIQRKKQTEQEAVRHKRLQESVQHLEREKRDLQKQMKELQEKMQGERQRLEAAKLEAKLLLRREAELRERDEQIRKLEAEKSQRKREREQEEVRHAQLQESVQHLEREKRDLQKQMKELQEKMQGERQRQEATKLEAESQLRLQAERHEREGQIRELEAEKIQRMREKEQEEVRHTRLQESVQHLEREKRELQKQTKELQEKMQSERQRLEAAKLEAESQLRREAESQLRRETELRERDGQIRELAAEKSQRKIEKEQEEVRRTQLQESVQHLEREKRDLQKQMKELQEKMQSERQRQEAVKLEKESQSQFRLEAELREHKSQIRELEAEKSQRKRERDQEEIRRTELQESVQHLEREKRDLQKQTKELQEKMQIEAAEWQQFQSDLQTAVAVADDFKQECEEQLKAVQQQLKKAQAENDRLRKMLQEAQGLGVDSIVTGQTATRISNMETPVVNGTFPGRGRHISPWAVVSPPTGDVVKSNSQRSLRTPALIETRVTTTKEGDTHQSRPIPHAMETTREKLSEAWAEDSGAYIRRYGGSKRGVFLRWCQSRTQGYKNIAITNFSSSWTDGMALCALLHTYLPERIPYQRLDPMEKRKNLNLAFEVAESIGIQSTLSTEEMLRPGGPDWQQVLGYIESVHQHFEA
ncbi:trichohyalin-like [Rhinatrema bivittatum]|uniref:trichohyalin-like n=1 Tax=Rhinatrema bivittatum TaxID=194408 RepID=UPI00112B4770|nr:trichohyalin-like [Rhinatrema bivittatum]